MLSNDHYGLYIFIDPIPPLNIFSLSIISFTKVVNLSAFPQIKIFDKKKSALVIIKTACIRDGKRYEYFDTNHKQSFVGSPDFFW
jgi:hypothetical protein